ncbi:MAG: hypothetical protein IJK84_07515 [Bacteroidales bacterium]|nr:hypothetical protein [Bacteroidales bacterium]
MKRYYVALIGITVLLVLAAFCTLWFADSLFQTIFPLLPLYFGVITGVQHYVVVKSLYKDPRTFVKNFLGLTVGSLFLHLAILCLWAFTHMPTARNFILAFCICYIVYLAFETIQLVLLVRKKRNE